MKKSTLRKWSLILSLLAMMFVAHQTNGVAATVIYNYDFENGQGDWYPDNGIWEVGSPTGEGPGGCHGGTQCAATILSGNFPPDTDSHLISPSITLPVVSGDEELHLRFWHWFSYPYRASGQVDISYYDPSAARWSDREIISTYFNGSSIVWSRTDVDLTAYSGKKVKISFFHATHSSISLCWYIDDIEIIAPSIGETFNLTVSKTGTGSGSVTANSGTITWNGNTGTAVYNSGTSITLTAAVDSGSAFGGWQGCDSSSANQCTVMMNAAKTVAATFNLQECSYSVSPTNENVPSSGGTSTITVTASSRECSESWTAESNEAWITVTSGSGAGSGTVGYSVSANQTGLERTGTITVAMQTFTVVQLGLDQRILLVNAVGQGMVTSEPSGIRCGTDCSEAYTQDFSVVLTATPSVGSTFEGWSGGGCSGTSSCIVTLSDDTTVTARFSAPRIVKLGPQVLMAGFDPILLDLSTTRFRIEALVREGNQPIDSVSITNNVGSLAFAMNLIGSLSNGDLLYGAEFSIDRGLDFSLPNLFGSETGQILIKAVDTTGLSHSFPTVVYGNNPDLALTQGGTDAPLFAQQGCKRLLPQVLMAGLEPTSLDFDDTEIKVRAMVREGARPIQDVSLNMNNSSFRLAMDLVETLPSGDQIYEKEIVFQRGSFGDIESSFENLWGGWNNQFMIEVRDDAGQRHSFPDVRRGDYRTINAGECWSDQ